MTASAEPEASPDPPREALERPDLLRAAGDRLSPVERRQIAFIRETFEAGPVDRSIRLLQRQIGSRWITSATSNLRQVHGLDRLPPLDPSRSFILASNHRSFFDLYIVTAHLVRLGILPHRIVFPVRAEFFYDRWLGLAVNGVMSFFAMYPPVFRDRRRAALNVVALDEIAWMLRRGGAFVGIHPEGTRKKDDDPYTFLPAQSGVGRLIHHSRVEVIPVFVNGLQNDLVRQVTSNFDGTGTPVHIVFGRPVDYGDLLDRRGSPRVYKALAERTLEVIGELGQEERRYRQGDASL